MKRCRRVSDGEDAGLRKGCGLFHRHKRSCHAARFCFLPQRPGSAIKQCTSPPSLAKIVLLIPAFAICVSVTISQPLLSASMPRFHSVRGKDEIIRVVKIRGRVDGALDDKLVFGVKLARAKKLGNDFEAARFNLHGLEVFQHGRIPFCKRPETGRQTMGWRKNESAGSPRRAFWMRACMASSGPTAFPRGSLLRDALRPSGEIRARESCSPARQRRLSFCAVSVT